ncbi:hypothetical protein CC80DRAFT_486023 [Byssothecium circinans]|uniref:Rhodopsin domain-containing protein n=1 Tax=Byssothecium circinans TaxID=147558 RepID=A0A6A5T763_9PLEO|nr:hypothetical protein CC80DRAFT_486023 [Byssothecium circinans]
MATPTPKPPALTPEYLAEDASPPLFRTAILFMVLQTIFLVLFIISRFINKTAKGLDFYLLIPLGYIFVMANCSISLIGIAIGGTGRHQVAILREDPTGNTLMNYFKLLKAQEFVQQAAVAAPKLAILVLYTRVFTTRPYRTAVYVVAGAIIATWLGAGITSLTICRPFGFNWDKKIRGGKCGDVLGFYRAICVPNLVTDFVVAIMPMPILWDLKVKMTVKIGLALTFLIGSFGIVISTIRTVMFFRDERLSIDRTFSNVHLFIWTVVEPGSYFLCVCMPSLKPLQRKIFGNSSITATIANKVGTSGRGKGGSKLQSELSSASGGGKNGIRITHAIRQHGSLRTGDNAEMGLTSHGYVELDEYDQTRVVPGKATVRR